MRADTLALLAELDDDTRVDDPRCAWADGTVGGIMAGHADHTLMHQQWAAAGHSGRGIARPPAALSSPHLLPVGQLAGAFQPGIRPACSIHLRSSG